MKKEWMYYLFKGRKCQCLGSQMFKTSATLPTPSSWVFYLWISKLSRREGKWFPQFTQALEVVLRGRIWTGTLIKDSPTSPSYAGQTGSQERKCQAHLWGILIFHLSPQVFWLAGSLLIIGLASVVIPTIGWRWLIRIASIPGIILILAFKVRMLMRLCLILPSSWPFCPMDDIPLNI